MGVELAKEEDGQSYGRVGLTPEMHSGWLSLPMTKRKEKKNNLPVTKNEI